MARYIDADKMREEWLENGENEYVYDTNSVLDSIDAQPTADVVEVVRCKDCKHRETSNCPMFSFEYQEWVDDYQTTDITEDNGFCQYGERSDNFVKIEVENLRASKNTVVYGKWVNTDFGTTCTACGRSYDPFEKRPTEVRKLKSCPNCGADMRGEEK